MKPTVTRFLLTLALLAAGGSRAWAQETACPLKVSADGRYFVDQNNAPVFWLGTTQWQLWRDFTLEQSKLIIEKSKSHGFTFIQVKLLGGGDGTNQKKSDGTQPNVYGEKPWIDDNPLTPNEAFFKNVDAVVKMAADNGMFVLPAVYHQSYRTHITAENARAWAKWLGQRYKDVPNIVWTSTPQARKEFIPVIEELAAGLREGDGGRHLISFKPDPSPYSSSFMHDAKWLDFNSMQTWNAVKLIYPMLTYDYRLTPAKPILMAEGAYEAGTEYGFPVTPLWVRRQAYYTYLAGAVHAYGHNDTWRVSPTWKEALDAPGAVQMGVLKQIFMARKEWWRLVPDQTVFASGGEIVEVALPKYDATEKERTAYVRTLKPSLSDGAATGDLLHLAARHADGRWAMIYLADKAAFSVNMNKIAAPKVNLSWVNPIDGHAISAGQEPNTGVKSFRTPDDWEDSLLILEGAE